RGGHMGRGVSASRRLTRQQVRDALLAQCDNNLRPCKSVSGRSVAVDGRFGSTGRDVAFRPDYSLPLRDDPKGPAARQQRTAPEPLMAAQYSIPSTDVSET